MSASNPLKTMERHDDPNELNEAPFLRGIGRHDPFVVPEGFFDRFPSQVQHHLLAHAERKVGFRWTGLFERSWPRVMAGSALAAALAVLVWLAWPHPKEESTTFAALEPEEVLDEGLDDEILYHTILEEEDLMTTVSLPDDDAEVLAYLENEELPLDLLIEEL